MAHQYKFKNPSDAVELDPKQGHVITNGAVVHYHFNSWTSSLNGSVETTVELSIDCQDFAVADLDDLISFLQTARAKLVEQNNATK